MTRSSRLPVRRHLACLALTGLAATLVAGAAFAVDARVRSACTGDFLTYCSQHDPEGPAARQCMRANGARLSTTCVNALVAAGEVSKQQVAKRAPTSNRSERD